MSQNFKRIRRAALWIAATAAIAGCASQTTAARTTPTSMALDARLVRSPREADAHAGAPSEDAVMSTITLRDEHGVVIATPRIFAFVGQTANCRIDDGTRLISVDVLAQRLPQGVVVEATLKSAEGKPLLKVSADAAVSTGPVQPG